MPSGRDAWYVSPKIGLRGFSNVWQGYMYDIDPTITCFILYNGSSQLAAAFRWADIGPATLPMICKIESVDINLIGKLVFARLNFPEIIYLPI